MKKAVALFLVLCMMLSIMPVANVFATDTFAGEIPANVDATKTVYEYNFGSNKVNTGPNDIAEVTSYSNVTAGDPWKFANQAGMEWYYFNGQNGITLRTNVADVGNGANVILALYVPKAGDYTFEYTSITRDNSGSLDMYFAKCPDDFEINSAGTTLPFEEDDKIADDVSFYVGGVNVRDYIAVDNVVSVPEAGTYLVGFTDFNTVSGADYSADSKIRQEIKDIRLTQTVAGEVPANIDATKTEFEYLFGNDKVNTGSSDVSRVTSYSNVTAGDPWKLASQAGMENYSFNGANGITLRTNVSDMGSGANVVLALYIPKAGSYNFEYSSITRDNSGSLDMYFAKCPDDFTASSAGTTLPFAEKDKIADDVSFYVGGVNVRDYIALDNPVSVPEAGTYLIGFTDFKTVSGADYSADSKIRQEIKGIKLTPSVATDTFAGEIPANVDATKTVYEYNFGSNKVNTDPNDIAEVTSYSNVTAGDPWKFASQAGMEWYYFNGQNGFTLRTNVADIGNGANMILALYVPKAGYYTFEYTSITRDNSGSLDMYFAKCPDDFEINSAGTTLPFEEDDKIADDVSFYVGGVNVRDYIALDNPVSVPEAGTYLIGFTDFNTVSGADYSADSKIRQEIKDIRLTATVAPEDNKLKKVVAEISDSELMYGETANITFTATRNDLSVIPTQDCTVTYEAVDPSVVSVSSDGVVTAIGHGKTDVKVKVSHDGKEASTKVTVTAVDNTGVAEDTLTYSDTLFIGDVTTLVWKVKTVAGNEITIPFDSVTVTPSEEDILSIDSNGKVTALDGGEVTLSLSATFAEEPITAEATILVKKNVLASEVPEMDSEKDAYEYVFARSSIISEKYDYVGVDTSKVTSYELVDSTKSDPWKFANVSNIANYGLDTNNGVRVDVLSSAVGTGANLSMAIYVPRAGIYDIEFGSVTRAIGGTMDIYFSKCPDDFEVNTGADALIGEEAVVKPADKVGDDVSFWSSQNKIEGYRALETVNVQSAGTYLITFADFKKSSASTDETNIQQSVTKIKLTPSVAAATNAIIKLEAEISDSELMYGETANITFAATRYDQTPLPPENATVTYEAVDSSVVSVSEDGVVTAIGHGTTDITVKVSDGNRELEKKVSVTALDNTGVAEDEVILSEALSIGDITTLVWKVKTVAGNEIDLPFDSITVTPSAENILLIDSNGKVTALAVGEVTLSLSATFMNESLTAEKTITVSRNYVASEVPEMDSEKDTFEYVFAMSSLAAAYKETIGSDTSKVTSYEYVNLDVTDPWKFANVSGIPNYGLDTGNGVRIDVTGETVGTGANLSMAIYVPRTGTYLIEFGSVVRPIGGTMDIYFSKCPDDFEVNKGGDTFIGESSVVKPADRLGNDLSFWNSENKIEGYRPLGAVTITEPGTYLVTFAGFGKSEASAGENNIQQSVTKIKLSPFSEEMNGIYSIDLSIDKAVLNYGETAQISWSGILLDQKPVDPANCSVSYVPENIEVVSVDDNGRVTAIGHGKTNIEVTVNDRKRTATAKISVEAIDTTGVESSKIVGFTPITVTGKEAFVWEAKMNSGNYIKIPMDTVTASFSNPGIASIDEKGYVTGIAEGETVMTLSTTFVDEEIEQSVALSVIPIVPKTEPSLYTYEMRANAQENIKKYDWAKSSKDSAVKAADALLPYVNEIMAILVGEGIPRAEMPGAMKDDESRICKYCGENVNSYPGYFLNCGWSVDILRNPWKIKCPACSRSFPSNDFGGFYELGLDEHGRFDRMRALEAHRDLLIEKNLLSEEAINMSAPSESNIAEWYLYYGYGVKGGYLHNDLYPGVDKVPTLNNNRGLREGETVEMWGVDDGFGYKPRDINGNVLKYQGLNVEECHAYVGTYLNWGYAFFIQYIGRIGEAYLLTGDPRYGRPGALLIDRLADLYPTYDVNRNQGGYYALTDGLTGLGHVRGRIHATGDSSTACKMTDVFFPMLSDPEVQKALAEKDKKYNLNNDKSSAEAIWNYWEENILIHTYHLVRTGRADGNYGMPQATMAQAAIATNREPYTSMMFDWIFESNNPANDVVSTHHWLQRNGGDLSKLGPISTEVSIIEGGDFNATMVNNLDRDGFPDEVSFFYNGVRLSNLQNVTEAMARYTGEKDYNLYSNPKYIALHESFLKTPLMYFHQPNLGDGTDIATKNLNLDTGAYKKFFEYTEGYEDIKETAAILLYIANNNSAEGYNYSIYSKDPEILEDIIEGYVEDVPKQPSVLLSGYGFAALRDGYKYEGTANQAVDNQRDMWIFFGRNGGHSQSSIFHLGMDAYGLNIAPDNGYPEWASTDPETLQWNGPSIAHNTVTVDGKNVSGGSYINGLPLHFDDSENVKLVDVRHPGAYTQTSEYRRTLVMVKVDDDSSYGLDFFRVTGGDMHTYGFHAQAENASAAEGLSMVKQADENGEYIGSYAGYDPFYDKSANNPAVNGDSYYDENPDAEDMKGYWPVGKDPNSPAAWSYETVYPRGYTWLGKVRRAANPDEKFAVEFDIKDYRNYVKNGDKIGLRVTQLNDFAVSEVALAAGKNATRSGNAKMPDTFDYMLVKREGKNLDSLFTTVYEPYMETRYLEDMENVEVTVDASSEAQPEASDMVKAVKVIHKSGRVDYIVYASNNKVTYNVGGEFIFRGFVGMVTKNEAGEVIDRYLSDGDILVDTVMDTIEYTGVVEDYTRELALRNYIDVTLNEAIEASELVGKHIYINVPHNIENGVYLIKGAEEIDGGMIRLDIGNVSLIRSYVDTINLDKGFVYNIGRGNTFRIPLTYTEDLNPTFSEVQDGRVSVGSMYSQVIMAEGKNGAAVTIEGRTLPRGATFDAATGTFSWKPTMTQIGINHVSLNAVDEFGRETTVHFIVDVYGSVSGGGGGGGGGGDTPSTDKPTDEPKDEPTVEPDEPKDEPKDEPTGDEPVVDVPTEKGFTDLGNHAWAEDAINALAEAGIIKGTSDVTFAPQNNITRADYAILLVRAFKLESENAENFADVNASDYFAEELAVARNTGIVGGIGDNKYAPRNTVTRQDMMVILYRALTKMGVELKPIEGIDVTTYADYADVADYARDAVKALVEAGLVNGKGESLAGSDFTTRAEVAVLLKRVLDYIQVI